MQTALIHTLHASQSVIGVAMVAAYASAAFSDMRPAWANPKHPR